VGALVDVGVDGVDGDLALGQDVGQAQLVVDVVAGDVVPPVPHQGLHGWRRPVEETAAGEEPVVHEVRVLEIGFDLQVEPLVRVALADVSRNIAFGEALAQERDLVRKA